jgi:hemerythrin superfamily protein
MARTIGNTLDAVALLKADHRAVEALFEEFESATRKDQKQKIAQKICLELTVHATIEEEIFYPACKGMIEEDALDEAYVEHDGAKVLIAEISQGSPGDNFYDAKVKVLSEDIKHHVKEEERRAEGIFAQAKAAGLDMDNLGDRLLARKKELQAQFKSSGLPPPETRSMKGASLTHGQPLEAKG